EILRSSAERLCRRLKLENSKPVEVEMIVDMPHDCYMFCDSKQKTVLEACDILVEKIRAMNGCSIDAPRKGSAEVGYFVIRLASCICSIVMLTVSSFTSSSNSSSSTAPPGAFDSIID
ncbi:hypothetical protein FOZ63_017984, partial [Perkinsus olseni]